MAGVAADDAQMMIASISAGLPLARAGHVRPLLVFAAQPTPLLPSTPTAVAAGVPVQDLDAWIGLMGPAGLPDALVARVNAAVNSVLDSAEAQAWAVQQGLLAAPGSSADFGATLRGDHARWKDVIRSLAIASGH
jgi:tripartite-type tricarboxylate transporter receptor subunit TctC